jgi:hypothetical protein
MGDIGDMFRYRDVDRETVRVINQNVAANSTRFIMGPFIEQLESVVLRSASTAMDSTPRRTIETSYLNDAGSLQKISTNPRRYFYLNNSTIAP